MARRMLIDASHPEETRVVVVDGTRLEDFDYEMASRKPLKGNIYLAKVIRIEPSLQAAFVEYGGNRHGFLAFSEIHADYYQIPVADRERLIAEQQRMAAEADDEPEPQRNRVDRSDIEEANEQPLEPAHAEETSPVETQAAEIPADSISAPVEAAPAETAPVEAAPIEQVAVDQASGEPVPADQASTDQAPADSAPVDPSEAPQPEATVETLGGDEAGVERERRERRRRQPVRHYKIQEVIKRRQILLVQVVKEERGNKGAALTTYLSLAGRYCVLMPNAGRGGGISRKISNPSDRKRMKEMLAELEVPQGMGVILRTAGLERSNIDIKRDYEYLSRLWDSIRDITMRSTAPALIYEEGDLIKRSLRDVYDTDIAQVLVEGEAGFTAASEFMRQLVPHQAGKVELYKEQIPLFHRYQVESQFDAMHSPTVQLRSGGYIVINPTEALVAIDVNSGRSTRERNIEETALRTNLEAAEEIARQVRLRDLAGLVVIDFIDMDEHRHQRQVEHKIKDAMRNDRARIQIGRISAFGLLEMSRQRLRPSLLEHSTEVCPHCAGTGRVRSLESAALHAMRAIEEEGVRRRASEIVVSVPPNVALYLLNQKRHALSEIEQRYGFHVIIEADEELHAADCEIERVRSRRDDRPSAGPELARASYDHVEGERSPAGDDAGDRQYDGPDEGRDDEPESRADGERSREGRDDDGGRRRRRRRRRRGRGDGEGREGGGRDAGRDGGREGEPRAHNGHDANGHDLNAQDTPRDEAGEDRPEREAGPNGEARDRGDGQSDGDRRRRRGRRGGRRRHRENGEGENAPRDRDPNDREHGDRAPDHAAESGAEPVAHDTAPVQDSSSGERHITSDTPAPPPPPPPVPVFATAPEPAPAPAAEPPPPVVPVISADAPPEKPKRGWWRR